MFFLYSCGKCTCQNPIIKGINLDNLDTATEQTANIDVYYKSAVAFSSLSGTSQNIKISNANGHGDIEFGFDFDHDYIVTINPIGKILKIKNIAHGSYSKQNMGFQASCQSCINSITYTVNDSIVNFPQQVTPVVDRNFYLGINQ
jgi:hypothetical protein